MKRLKKKETNKLIFVLFSKLLNISAKFNYTYKSEPNRELDLYMYEKCSRLIYNKKYH